MVTRPGVIGWALDELYPVIAAARQLLLKQSSQCVRLRRDDEQCLVGADLVGQAQVAVGHLPESRLPVGAGMRPRELYAALGKPLGGQARSSHLGCVRGLSVALQMEQGEVSDVRGRQFGKKSHTYI